MGRWFRALVALAEDPGSIPSTYTVVPSAPSLWSRKSDALSDLHRHHIRTWCADILAA